MTPGSKNRRRNTGAILVLHPEDKERRRVVLVDVGKLSWESLITAFTTRPELDRLDAVVLTHEHSDACAGLDSLRDFTDNWWTDADGKRAVQPLPVFLTRRTYACVKATFAYMVRGEPEAARVWAPPDGGGATAGAPPATAVPSTTNGGVPSFRFTVFEEGDTAFDVCGMPVVAFPVNHGPACDFTAFRLGPVLHLTDCRYIPDASRRYLAGTDVAVVDVLDNQQIEYRHPSHWRLSDVVEEVKAGFGVDCVPSQLWYVGMSHSIGHDELQAASDAAGLPCAAGPAFDGQYFDFAWARAPLVFPPATVTAETAVGAGTSAGGGATAHTQP